MPHPSSPPGVGARIPSLRGFQVHGTLPRPPNRRVSLSPTLRLRKSPTRSSAPWSSRQTTRWANLYHPRRCEDARFEISLSVSSGPSATHDMHPTHGLTPPSSKLLALPHSSAQQIIADCAQDSNNWTSGRERGGARSYLRLSTLRAGQFRAILFDKLVRTAAAHFPGLRIVILWTPAHIGTLGNELADDAAKAATRLPPPPSVPVSLTTCKRQINTRILERWRDL
ncbi:hypothetical protein FB451DRAFT_1559939 [Mycena latifolia]|nr:hypothetical protein FB451DRAFT_1559939 [Mycena latifolia]